MWLLLIAAQAHGGHSAAGHVVGSVPNALKGPLDVKHAPRGTPPGGSGQGSGCPQDVKHEVSVPDICGCPLDVKHADGFAAKSVSYASLNISNVYSAAATAALDDDAVTGY